MGFVCGGTIFIVENITEAVRALSGNMVVLSNGAVFVILAILLTPLVLIRNIAKLSPTALLSDALIVAGLLALLVFDCIQLFKHGEPRTGPDIHWVFNSQQYAVFIGTAVYSFEGIGERKKDQARTCLSSHLLPSHHLRRRSTYTNQRVSEPLPQR